MKWLARLLAIAALMLMVLFFFTNPQQLDRVWLWMIGFAGHFILLLQKGYKLLVGGLQAEEKTDQSDPLLSFLPSLATNNEKASIEEIERRLLRIENYLKTGGSGPNRF